jgi:ammonium transporter Rh
VIVTGFDKKIDINMLTIIEAEFCAAACLITMGALLGKCTFPQMMMIATIESVFFTLNAVLLFEFWHILDIGGAMTIHMFGCYFGLAASMFYQPTRAIEDANDRNGGTYNSQLIAMVGTVFLFMYWPSFNAILADGMAQQRAIINTVFSITASALASVYLSRVWLGKMDMEVLLNATLAGGVMMGAACDIIVDPGYCMLSGAIAGLISAYGYLVVNAELKTKLNFHDTCGVHFLHGIPGILGSIVAVVAVACTHYNFENETQMKALLPKWESRTVGEQVGYQCAGIVMSLIISLLSGGLTGALTAKMIPMPAKQYDDTVNFAHVEYGDSEGKEVYPETEGERPQDYQLQHGTEQD